VRPCGGLGQTVQVLGKGLEKGVSAGVGQCVVFRVSLKLKASCAMYSTRQAHAGLLSAQRQRRRRL
jgi:hypothetical protein